MPASKLHPVGARSSMGEHLVCRGDGGSIPPGHSPSQRRPVSTPAQLVLDTNALFDVVMIHRMRSEGTNEWMEAKDVPSREESAIEQACEEFNHLTETHLHLLQAGGRRTIQAATEDLQRRKREVLTSLITFYDFLHEYACSYELISAIVPELVVYEFNKVGGGLETPPFLVLKKSDEMHWQSIHERARGIAELVRHRVSYSDCVVYASAIQDDADFLVTADTDFTRIERALRRQRKGSDALRVVPLINQYSFPAVVSEFVDKGQGPLSRIARKLGVLPERNKLIGHANRSESLYGQGKNGRVIRRRKHVIRMRMGCAEHREDFKEVKPGQRLRALGRVCADYEVRKVEFDRNTLRQGLTFEEWGRIRKEYARERRELVRRITTRIKALRRLSTVASAKLGDHGVSPEVLRRLKRNSFSGLVIESPEDQFDSFVRMIDMPKSEDQALATASKIARRFLKEQEQTVEKRVKRADPRPNKDARSAIRLLRQHRSGVYGESSALIADLTRMRWIDQIIDAQQGRSISIGVQVVKEPGQRWPRAARSLIRSRDRVYLL